MAASSRDVLFLSKEWITIGQGFAVNACLGLSSGLLADNVALLVHNGVVANSPGVNWRREIRGRPFCPRHCLSRTRIRFDSG